MMADVEIKYKGVTRATMTASGAKTVKTGGKWVEGDIVVEYNKPSGPQPSGTKQINITENGTSLHDVAGYAYAEITAAVPTGEGAPSAGIVFDTVNAQGMPVTASLYAETVPESVCRYWATLTSITFHLSGPTPIRQAAFANSGLTSVVIPDEVTAIHAYAFQNTHLTTVRIPASVTSIAAAAFQGVALTAVHLPETPPTLATATAFNALAAGCVFYVPTEAAKTAYQSATNWSTLNVTWEVET